MVALQSSLYQWSADLSYLHATPGSGCIQSDVTFKTAQISEMQSSAQRRMNESFRLRNYKAKGRPKSLEAKEIRKLVTSWHLGYYIYIST